MRLRRLDHIANDNSFREEVVIYEGDIYPFLPLRRLLFLLIRGLSSPVRPLGPPLCQASASLLLLYFLRSERERAVGCG